MHDSSTRLMPLDHQRRLSLARVLDASVEYVLVTKLSDGSVLVTPSDPPPATS